MIVAESKNKNNLPKFFAPLFWDVHFVSVDTETHDRRIIVKTINHGGWEHWVWIFKYYGKAKLKKIIREIPETEFRKPALKLISLLLGIKTMKYASRSDYIKSKKALRKTAMFS